MTTAHELRCEMDARCPYPVTMIDEKGYIYCREHGLERRGPLYCRKLRPHELRGLERGDAVRRY